MIEFLLSWITTLQYLWSFMTFLSFISFITIISLPFAIINFIVETVEYWKESKGK